MCPDWAPTAFLIAAPSQSRVDRVDSDGPEEAVTATLSDRSPDCIRRVCRVTNFSPFSLSALSGRINAVQFQSLSSAFPGQSQAFTEFSPNTPTLKKHTHTYAHTKKPAHLSNHPFILYLCSCNFNRSLSNTL